jgi:predicted RNase H-like HicB family nuclease
MAPQEACADAKKVVEKDECGQPATDPAAILTDMGFDDYKTVLYRQDGAWVAEIPSFSGCYALMPTREAALVELRHVFDLIAEEYREKGRDLPADTTEIVNA